jgi:hypothetical protein
VVAAQQWLDISSLSPFFPIPCIAAVAEQDQFPAHKSSHASGPNDTGLRGISIQAGIGHGPYPVS